LASVADNVKVIMKTKYNISSVFSAEKLNAIVPNNYDQCHKNSYGTIKTKNL
jgi:hypothetical protein